MKTKIITITPQLAKQFIEHSKQKNRHINQRAVLFYSNEMKLGKWLLTGQGISFDRKGNIIDGQHRLLAIIHSGVTIESLVITDCEGINFAVYDTHRARTATDVLSISDVKNSSIIASAIKTYVKLCKGLTGEGGGTREFGLSNSDIVNEYKQNSNLWDDCMHLGMRAYTKLRIYKEGFLGGFAFYLIRIKQHDFDFVQSFYYQVVGIIPDKQSTTKTLRDLLIKDSFKNKKYPQNLKQYFMVRAWNDYLKNKDRKIFQYNTDHEFPEIL